MLLACWNGFSSPNCPPNNFIEKPFLALLEYDTNIFKLAHISLGWRRKAMGIYDRDYYRNERSSFLGSITDSAPVCKWIIIINIGVFLAQLFTTDFQSFNLPGIAQPDYGIITNAFILNKNAVLQGQVWRLLSYAFLHDPFSIFHILFNMLFLWWFGHQLESIYGSREFLAFYLLSGLLGGIAFTMRSVFQPDANCLGASGAVTAVMLLYACHFPHRRIYLFFLLPIPIWLFVGFQIFRDILGFAHSVRVGGQGGVAFSVHLAGALFGFLYFRFGWRLMPILANFRFDLAKKRRPKLRVYHEESREPVGVSSRSSVDEQFEAKVDAVLEKIQRFGKDSLTEGERELLQQASELYKQRRT